MFKRICLSTVAACLVGFASHAYASDEDFSLRGIRFGMTKSDLKKSFKVNCMTVGGSDWCTEQSPKIGSIEARSITYNFANGKIMDIDAIFYSERFDRAREAVTIKYGTPNSYQVKAVLEGGIAVPATQWIWESPNVEIIMQYPHYQHNAGSLRYLPPGSFKANMEAHKNQSQRDARDF